MSKQSEPSSPADVEDLLDADLLFGPIELACYELSEAGEDPHDVGVRGAQFVQTLRDQQTSWQKLRGVGLRTNRVNVDLDAFAEFALNATSTFAADRASLISLLNEACMDSRYVQQLNMAFEGRRTEEIDEDELRRFLEDVGAIERLEKSDDE